MSNNRLQTKKPKHCAYCDYVGDEAGLRTVPVCEITGEEVTWYGVVPVSCPLDEAKDE